MAECAAALAPFVDWDLLDVLRDEAGPRPAWTSSSPRCGRSWSRSPSSGGTTASSRPPSSGHSQGEIAAACVAGILTLEDGARVVALRAAALGALAGRGGMVSVPLPVADIDLGDGLSVAAVNGPRSTVVSGAPDALDALLAREERARRDSRSTTPLTRPASRRSATACSPTSPPSGPGPERSRSFPRSPASGPPAWTPDYWYRNLRETVRFGEATRNLLEHGAFIEVSPHPVLTVGVQETIDEAGADAVVLGTLRRDEGGLDRFRTSLAEAYTQGVAVDWRPAFPRRPHRRPADVRLPARAFLAGGHGRASRARRHRGTRRGRRRPSHRHPLRR